MSTPHNAAKKGEFAETVIFPGDPLRAKSIAENFLEDAKLLTSVRNIYAYTGMYKGHKLSVMASGMGIPSASIYATELIKDFGVKNILRVGTSGGFRQSGIKMRDIIIAQGACTDSAVNRTRFANFDFAATADFKLLYTAYQTAQEHNIDVKVGNCFTSDYFYDPEQALERYAVVPKMGVLCSDMETAGLYGVAHEYKARALAMFTVSDMIETEPSDGTAEPNLTWEERQNQLNKMITLSLETAIKL